jgi:uroporphyrin-III C-methyltransferase
MEQSLKPKGKVFICGAGPGDPQLLTVRATRLLQGCDVILHDRLVSQEILEVASKTSKKIYVGRASGDPTKTQKKTNNLMLNFANEGKKILRLKGGDPFIFGRGGEEAEFLASHGVEYEIIPGISSFAGAAGYAGIPLTHRRYSSSLAVVTGHGDAKKDDGAVNWRQLARSVDTIVVLMGLERIGTISRELIRGGLDKNTEVAVVENATSRKQRIIISKLGDVGTEVKEHSVGPPSVIIIGKVVRVRKKIQDVIKNRKKIVL